ncbi:MAG: hypothetical protein WAL70_14930 [Aeromicrobium sp.]
MPKTARSQDVLRPLLALMSVAFAVSVVHYLDNTVNYADFPQAEPGSALPNPSQTLVAAGWFIFTAFGVLGLWLFVRGRITAAAIAIAVYSGSGLVGFGHYAVPGATDMVWWRQTHVIADIICGLLLFAFALWSIVALREKS